MKQCSQEKRFGGCKTLFNHYMQLLSDLKQKEDEISKFEP